MTVSMDRCTVIEMTSEITHEKNEDFKKSNRGNALDTSILDFFSTTSMRDAVKNSN